MHLLSSLRRQNLWLHRSLGLAYVIGILTLSELPIFAPLGDQAGPSVIWLGWAIPLVLTEVVLQWRRTVGPVAAR